MFRNYFKTAWRKLFKQRLLSFITICGLGISLSVCLVVLLFIKNEVSYDSFQSRADRIALFQQFDGSAGSGSGFARLFSNLSHVEQVTRIIKVKPLIHNSIRSFSSYENNFCFADSNFLKVFDLGFIDGNPDAAFSNPDGILISEKIALKYFQNQNPIGQPLSYDDKKIFFVTGVFKGMPGNSHVSIDLIANSKNAAGLIGQNLEGWWDNMSLTYILLSKNSKFSNITDQLKEVIKQTKDQNGGIWKPAIIPLRDIYLKTKMSDARIKAPKAINDVYVFSIISLLIILLAAFNYINITTAKAISYLKEVGIRKIIGATKKQLIEQLLTESFLNVLSAAILALIGATIGIKLFNQITGSYLNQDDLFLPGPLIIYFSAIAVFAIINGLYPALFLTAFKPVNSVQKNIGKSNARHSLQKILITFQFSVSIAILIALLVVSRQLYFVHHQNLGYKREHILTLNIPGESANQANLKQTFLNQIRLMPSVESATSSTPLPGQGSMHNKLVETYLPKGKDLNYSYVFADRDFINTFEIPLLQGENFSSLNIPGQHDFLINETMKKYLELGNKAVGKPLAYYSYQYSPDGTYKEVAVPGKIIGVIKDYNQNNLYNAIEPMLIQLDENWNTQIAVKFKPTSTKNLLASLQNKWKQFFPGKPFEYEFLDDQFNNTYKSDLVTENALTVFSVLAMIISCLGLFGLIAIIIENKIKEIGIRKVLGASGANITFQFSKPYLVLLVIAISIASPVIYIIMNKWLQNFTYRVDISWWMFAFAGAISILIAFVTISLQTLRAASANPIKALRTD